MPISHTFREKMPTTTLFQLVVICAQWKKKKKKKKVFVGQQRKGEEKNKTFNESDCGMIPLETVDNEDLSFVLLFISLSGGRPPIRRT